MGTLSDKNGDFSWPGFGENMRILKWIFERVNGKKDAAESPFGYMPKYNDINWTGLEDFTPETFEEIMNIDCDAGKKEVQELKDYFNILEDRLPVEIENQRIEFDKRLNESPEIWRINS